MKARLLITLLVLSFGLSCSGGKIEGPDPHNDPEALARAYHDAIVSRDCFRAETYEQDHQTINATCFECQIVQSSLGNVVVSEFAVLDSGAGVNVLPNKMRVKFFGDFLVDCKDHPEWKGRTTVINYFLENKDNKWYIDGVLYSE